MGKIMTQIPRNIQRKCFVFQYYEFPKLGQSLGLGPSEKKAKSLNKPPQSTYSSKLLEPLFRKGKPSFSFHGIGFL